MALTRQQFHAIESVQEFDDMVRGAVYRHQVLEDTFGYLRRDLLIAQGVTYPEHVGEGPALPPKPGTPTFELVVGRDPVLPPAYLAAQLGITLPKSPVEVPLTPAEERAEEEAEQEIEDRRARGQAMFMEALAKRKQLADAGELPPGRQDVTEDPRLAE